jgi:hypothetical protein
MLPPWNSETRGTEELWSITNLLNWQNYEKGIFFCKYVLDMRVPFKYWPLNFSLLIFTLGCKNNPDLIGQTKNLIFCFRVHFVLNIIEKLIFRHFHCGTFDDIEIVFLFDEVQTF